MSVLSEFLSWASAQQVARLNSPFRITITLGPPTKKRAAIFEIELLQIEPSGWVTDNLVCAGTISVWESGEIDALIETPETFRDRSGPKYFGHWDDAERSDFGQMFSKFLGHFPADAIARIG